MGRQDIDFNGIARKLRELRKQTKPGDICKMYLALEELRKLPFPPGYIDSLRDEMMGYLTGKVDFKADPTMVYLAFFGSDGRASHMKIGVAKDVKKRIANFTTGNPMPSLWTYSACFEDRRAAMAVEAQLLKHMAPDRAHGEWVKVSGLAEQAARAVADSLAEVASAVHSQPVEFARAKV